MRNMSIASRLQVVAVLGFALAAGCFNPQESSSVTADATAGVPGVRSPASDSDVMSPAADKQEILISQSQLVEARKMITITGKAAKALYNAMSDLPESPLGKQVNFKYGKPMTCSKSTAQSAAKSPYKCVVDIDKNGVLINSDSM